MYTKQGYTLQFGTNVSCTFVERKISQYNPDNPNQCLGHHLLITLLLPTLLKTSSAHPENPSRIIVTSSTGHSTAPKGGIDYNSVKRSPKSASNGHSHTNGHSQSDESKELAPGDNELMTWIDYGQSKWGNIACAKWLDKVYGPRAEATSGSQRIGKGEIISVSVHPGEFGRCFDML